MNLLGTVFYMQKTFNSMLQYFVYKQGIYTYTDLAAFVSYLPYVLCI